jgi:hypothetical protein
MQLLAEEADIGLVILDLDVLDRNGLPALGELRGRHPEVSVVVVSSTLGQMVRQPCSQMDIPSDRLRRYLASVPAKQAGFGCGRLTRGYL